jgi:hypothetical protein
LRTAFGGVVIQLFGSCNRCPGWGLLVGNHIVDASSLVSLYPLRGANPF